MQLRQGVMRDRICLALNVVNQVRMNGGILWIIDQRTNQCCQRCAPLNNQRTMCIKQIKILTL